MHTRGGTGAAHVRDGMGGSAGGGAGKGCLERAVSRELSRDSMLEMARARWPRGETAREAAQEAAR